jgi:hypothetical protein
MTPDPNRHVVEIPDRFAVARWSRDADVATIARCILATLKYEPHTADLAMLRDALEGVARAPSRSPSPPPSRCSQCGKSEGSVRRMEVAVLDGTTRVALLHAECEWAFAKRISLAIESGEAEIPHADK